jgi:hypothetical protein
MFWTKFVEIKTRILHSIIFISKSYHLWDKVEKYVTGRQTRDDNIIRRMRVASWITRAKDTLSEYVILIAVPRQLWLLNAPQYYVFTYILSSSYYHTRGRYQGAVADSCYNYSGRHKESRKFVRESGQTQTFSNMKMSFLDWDIREINYSSHSSKELHFIYKEPFTYRHMVCLFVHYLSQKKGCLWMDLNIRNDRDFS